MTRRGAKGGVILLLLFVLVAAGCSEESGQETGVNAATEEDAGDAQPLAVETDGLAEIEDVDVMQDGRSVAQRLQDATVATRVRKALVEEAGLRAFDLQTEAERGRLLLRGEVGTQAQRRRAEEIAAGVSGVRDVVNQVVAAEMPEQPETAAVSPDPARQDSPATATADARPEAAPEDKPAAETQQPAKEKPEAKSESGTFHTVGSGESLWIISRKYGVTVDDIKRLNNLRSNNLKPGERLRVK